MRIVKILNSDWNKIYSKEDANKIVLQLQGKETVEEINYLISTTNFGHPAPLKAGEWLLGSKGLVTLFLSGRGSTISRGDHSLEQ